MGNCKDCKHWGYYQVNDRRECSKNVAALNTAAPSSGGALAVISVDLDDNGGAALWTGHDFGCVLFEPAASAPEPAHQSQK